MSHVPDRLVTADELAEYLGVCRATIYNQMNRGLPSVTIGRARRCDPDRCLAWFADQNEAA